MHTLSSTRRQFLRQSGRLGLCLGAAGLASLGPGLSLSSATESRGRRVLIENLVDPRTQRAAAQPDQPDGASTVLSAQRPFTHVGLHWVGPAELPVQVQTSHDSVAWTPWRAVVVERAPGEAPGAPRETFAALVAAPRHRFVRYRVSDSASLGTVTATCLNSLDGPRLGSTIGSAPGPLAISRAYADGADFRSRIVTREEWGADESLRYGPGGEELWPQAYVAPRMVVVHHTATETEYEDASAEVRSIYAYHAVTQGFGDIGYNAIVDREGRIYEGRIGRTADPFSRFDRDILSYGVVAGHTFDYNYGTVGHALLGNYQEDTPTPVMLRALEDLLVFEHGRYQVDPRREIDFARASRLWRYNLISQVPHRDCTNTACPGDAVVAVLPTLRDTVAERLGAGPTPVQAIRDAPPRRNFWLGVQSAEYGWSGPAPYDCVYEGFHRQFGEDTVELRRGYTPLAMPEHIITAQRGVAFHLQEPGQYTLHLRPDGTPFADIRTILADWHVVRDNADEEGVTREGPWITSRNVLQFYGSNYEVAEADSTASFSWLLSPPEPGTYLVQACWAAGVDRSEAAPYTFGPLHGPQQTTYADQTRNGGVWVDLGTLALAADQPVEVVLRATTDGVVIADAVRLLQVDS